MKSIRVLGVDYTIEETDAPIIDGKLCLGLIDYDSQRIELYRHTSEQTKSLALLHEIGHAIFFGMDVQIDKDLEEKVVEMMARGLYQIAKDNGSGFLNYEGTVTKDEQNE